MVNAKSIFSPGRTRKLPPFFLRAAWAACLAFTVVALVAATTPAPLIWKFDQATVIGGNQATVLGTPQVKKDATGAGLFFDGVKDGVQLNVNPLAGLKEFTIQLQIRPDPTGPAEQRIFHIQDSADSRCLLEIRMTPQGWALDTFLLDGAKSLPLLDRTKLHSSGEWHWVTLRYDGHQMSSFVDGQPELSGEVAISPMQATGQTSIGVRLNQVYWFKGGFREVRIYPTALPPAEIAR